MDLNRNQFEVNAQPNATTSWSNCPFILEGAGIDHSHSLYLREEVNALGYNYDNLLDIFRRYQLRNNPNWVATLRIHLNHVNGNWYFPAEVQTDILNFMTNEIPNSPALNFGNFIAHVWVDVASQVQGRLAMNVERRNRTANNAQRTSQRALLSSEQRNSIRRTNNARQANQRALLSPEQRQSRQANQRALLSPEQRQSIRYWNSNV